MTLDQEGERFFTEYKPKYKVFYELMSIRMRNILVVSSIYDSFLLEEDGRLSDQVYEEFRNLNLRTLPRITRVSLASDALKLLSERDFDLVITMRRVGDMDAFTFGQEVKKIKNIPVILLLNSVVEIKYIPDRDKRGGIDRIFVWNGDSKIFVAIVKHLEDQYNADFDTQTANVRVFIFVEDSIRFYSLLLPELYGEIMRQTHRLILEGGNDYHDLLKMRIRPKILLAETYKEAMEYFKRYKNNVMGVICDVEFPHNGILDKTAGFSFVQKIREETINLPTVLQSSKDAHRKKAEELGCYFIYKSSQDILSSLNKWLLDWVGFGDFVFRDVNGKEIDRAKDVIEFYEKLHVVPIESLKYHGKNDHFSGWLHARGEFEIAEALKPRKVSEFTDQELREFLLEHFRKIVTEKTRGIVNDFSRESYHPEILFLRLRPGSLGGKGRGLAFLMFLLNSFKIQEEFQEIEIGIPKTVVIGTDEFDKFMKENNLYDVAHKPGVSDDEIKEKFVKAKLSNSIKEDLEFILKDLNKPLAVRSSSLLEDSAYQPFAGIFETYMVPNNETNIKKRLTHLCTAIKLVYASPFLKLARSYAELTEQTVEESKMAVVIQEVVGREHNNRYYPDFSGTASSYNFYPFGDYMKPEDRIASVALGLGRYIIEGENAIRFCPKYPRIDYFTDVKQFLNQSQLFFYAIDLENDKFDINKTDPYVRKYNLSDAIIDGTLKRVADTYDFHSEALRPGYFGTGSPVITFSQQLKMDTFPLAKLVSRIMSVGERAMGCSIEIEFAGNFGRTPKEKDKFYMLQIRPFLQQEELNMEEIDTVNKDQIVIFSNNVSGNLIRKDICDIVYVKPDAFNKVKTLEIVKEIDYINAKLVRENRPYILIGFGRWGTADRFLGIPVQWPNISGAITIIEASLKDFNIDFSQGSHFFSSIVAGNLGYLYVKHNSKKHYINWDWLNQQEIVEEKEYIRHIKTKTQMILRIDAKRREGMLIKPEENKQE
ncbi:MAG: PEP/pyruvate-binding domain-containing protein [Candidatus Heimdallarchaeaceae archaeon]